MRYALWALGSGRFWKSVRCVNGFVLIPIMFCLLTWDIWHDKPLNPYNKLAITMLMAIGLVESLNTALEEASK